jgi:hypothetical protein
MLVAAGKRSYSTLAAAAPRRRVSHDAGGAERIVSTRNSLEEAARAPPNLPLPRRCAQAALLAAARPAGERPGVGRAGIVLRWVQRTAPDVKSWTTR